MIPEKLRAGLECMADSTHRSYERCEKCDYRHAGDCYARIAEDTLDHLREIEQIVRVLPPNNDQRRVGYLYTVYDKIAKKYICKDKPARECALLLGYMTKQGFMDPYHKCERSTDYAFDVTRRKGLVTSGRNAEGAGGKAECVYTAKTPDGTILLEEAMAMDIARLLDISVKQFYEKMQRQAEDGVQRMVYHDTIIERKEANYAV